MKILAFETSCDDTSIALFENEILLAMQTKSQIHIHNETGGVVPEVASREHANVIFEVLEKVLSEADTTLRDIDYIGVTTHPWLVSSLLTGMTVASTLSETLDIPILPINHIQAHIFSNFLERKEEDIKFPLVCLTVSWGHNEIYYMNDMWTQEKLGQTQDDAAGEAFDKVAKMLGLGYPGGPIISKLALEYAVRREIERRQEKFWEITLSDQREISFEFQAAVNEVLSYKVLEAARQKWIYTILLAGGVSANDDLREKIARWCEKEGYQFFFPTKKIYCMDNAAMIGILTYYRVKYGKFEYKIGTVELGKS